MADDDVIYVDIEPKLNESAAEKEATRLRDRFKRHSKVDIEPNLDEAATDRASRRLRDRLEGFGKTIGDAFDHQLGTVTDKATDKAADKMRRKLDGIGKSFGDALGNELGNLFGDGGAGVGSQLGNAFKDHFGGIQDLFNKGLDLNNPLGQFDELRGSIRETLEGLRGLAPEASGAARALGTLTEAAGPLALALAGAVAVYQGIQDIRREPTILDTTPEKLGLGVPNRPVIQTPAGQMPLPGATQPALAPPGAPPGVQYQATPGSLNPFDALLPPGMKPPSTAITGPPVIPSNPLVPSIAPPDTGGTVGTRSSYTGQGAVPVRLVDSISSTGGGALGPGVGSEKGLQRDTIGVERAISSLFPQIRDIGGWRPPDGFNEHSSGQAIDVMIPGSDKALGNSIRDYVMAHAKELGVDYALWQQTQWNPNGTSSPMENRGSPTQNHMDHVHIHTVGGGYPTGGESYSLPGGAGGFPASPAGFGIPGFGLPTTPNMPSSTGRGPVSQTPTGSGQGAGVSGGGLIGAAEQAGVAAAGVAGFGAGGIAAQMAEQEINLAVQKGSQAAWAAASAPLETMWLQGGQMGAPSVSSPMFGWPGKLLSGFIGSQYASPNTAGAVQPPKDQKQGQQDQDQDPGSGNQSQGPTGSADDPIHTKSVTPPQGPPQGASTSAMNAAATMAPVTV